MRVALCHVIICISYHVIMCISFAYVFVSCIRAFSPLSVLQSDTPMPSGVPLSVSCCERVLNILGMARGLPSGLGIAPIDHLSSFVPFRVRLILQRLTEEARRRHVFCSPTRLQNGPITRPNPLYALGRLITIVWAKTAPHLDSSSSLYL